MLIQLLPLHAHSEHICRRMVPLACTLEGTQPNMRCTLRSPRFSFHLQDATSPNKRVMSNALMTCGIHANLSSSSVRPS